MFVQGLSKVENLVIVVRELLNWLKVAKDESSSLKNDTAVY